MPILNYGQDRRDAHAKLTGQPVRPLAIAARDVTASNISNLFLRQFCSAVRLTFRSDRTTAPAAPELCVGRLTSSAIKSAVRLASSLIHCLFIVVVSVISCLITLLRKFI